MQSETISVDDLILDPDNARLHSEKNIDSIKLSLKSFGQQKPIVIDNDNMVAAGNGTLIAAKELGWSKIDIVRSDLDKDTLKAFAIADNRTAELSDWDYGTLLDVMRELQNKEYDINIAGFSIDDIDELDGSDWTGGKATKDFSDFEKDFTARKIELTGMNKSLFQDAYSKMIKRVGSELTMEEALVGMCRHFIEGIEKDEN